MEKEKEYKIVKEYYDNNIHKYCHRTFASKLTYECALYLIDGMYQKEKNGKREYSKLIYPMPYNGIRPYWKNCNIVAYAVKGYIVYIENQSVNYCR